MKRDKEFYINAIKMDLYRVVTATGDIRKEIPFQSVKEFLQHADQDFDKWALDQREQSIRAEIRELAAQLYDLEDPIKRLRWAERILTARCRL